MQSAGKESRAATSCTECQRRKQKCSREWPCNHCQARKVPHICQFGPKKPQTSSSDCSSREKGDESRGRKRSYPESNNIESVGLNDDEEEPEDGLKIWGYMPGHVHFNLGHTNGRRTLRKESSDSSDKLDIVENVMHAVPPRSITDSIVNHFLSNVNCRYNAIYAPTFTNQYVQWWSDRAGGRPLSPEFTCLLLRALSYSVQYITPELRKMIEFELACSPQTLTGRFNDAADQLSQSFPASNTCIERVQELFYKGAWLKSESNIVESWHALGRTIREAQELGLDKEASNEGLAEFDVEIRRRLWTLLYMWDWQMSTWLGRPHLINQKELSFTLPSLRLDSSPAESNQLSPFAHIVLQAKIGRCIAPLMGDVQAVGDLSPEQVSVALEEMRRFIDDLPPIFRVDDPDLSLDEQHPYFVFQRRQLHVVIYMTMLDLLKPYLTRDTAKAKSPRDSELRKTGVEIALKMLDFSRLLFEHEFPFNAKFHMVVFSIFDTATILCSAMMHDVDNVLPHRAEVMDAIESALDMLQQLSLTTKLGASSYWFLIKLVQAAPCLSQYAPINKRQRRLQKMASSAPESDAKSPLSGTTTDTTTTTTSTRTTSAAEADEKSAAAAYCPEPVPDVTTTDDLAFDVEQFLAQNPFGDSASNMDIGGMEVVFDWDDLNLDWSVLKKDANGSGNGNGNGNGNSNGP